MVELIRRKKSEKESLVSSEGGEKGKREEREGEEGQGTKTWEERGRGTKSVRKKKEVQRGVDTGNTERKNKKG